MDNDIKKQVAEVTDELFEEAGPVEEAPQPTDFYQARRNDRKERSQKAASFGAPASMIQVVRAMCDDVEPAYNLTVNQYNHLKGYGMDAEAQTFLDSYIENDFLPLVMGVVDQYGADALLMNKQALELLDKLALTGNGEGTGYTAAFVQAMAPEVQGTVASMSDGEVEQAMAQMMQLADHGNNAGAIALAQSIKDRVDNGELSASGSDYAMLSKVSILKNR